MENLKNYLRDVLELEKTVYTLNQTLNRMDCYIKSLGIARNIQQPAQCSPRETFSNIIGIGLGCGAGAGVVIGLIVAIIIDGHAWDAMGIGLLSGLVLGAIVCMIIDEHYESEAAQKDQDLLEVYSDQVAQDQERVTLEQSTKDQALQYYNLIRDQLTSTQQVLSKLYSLNYVDPEYRDIVAIASFYHYFETEICDTLKGPNGAYKLYRAERNQNIIITQLNKVITQLEEIKYNQSMLYDAITESNRKVDQLTQISQMSLDYSYATARNSEIIAYNTAVTARNTEFLKWMEFFKG